MARTQTHSHLGQSIKLAFKNQEDYYITAVALRIWRTQPETPMTNMFGIPSNATQRIRRAHRHIHIWGKIILYHTDTFTFGAGAINQISFQESRRLLY